MSELIDRAPIERRSAEILEKLGEKAPVWVYGPIGAGRTLIEEALRRAHPTAVSIQPPSVDEPDAVAHCLIQLASATDKAGEEGFWNVPLRDRVAGLVTDIAAAGRVLLFRLPPSWELLTGRAEDDREHFRERAREFVVGLRMGLEQAPELKCVFFGSSRTPTILQDLVRQPTAVELAAPRLDSTALDDEERWGRYATPFRRLRDVLVRDGIVPAPLQLRLAVGIAAISGHVDMVASTLRAQAGSPNLEPLLAMLRQRLSHSTLRVGLSRLARARFAVSAQVAIAVAGLRPTQAPLILECLTYPSGEGLLRMTGGVRNALLSAAPRDPGALDAHWRLAGFYEERDGVLSPAKVRPETAIPWMEKLHHLAHSGAQGEAKWRENQLVAPELYWDRARALSVGQHDYRGAAKVYAECLKLFPGDNYATHYLAWNLERAGNESADVEGNYRKAVKDNPTNRWWNARLVTFLIGQARLRDADHAWAEVLDRLDPNGDLIQSDLHLALHVHRWVVAAWLDAGEVVRARRVFNLIPESAARDRRIEALGWRLHDAEEALALGESVYPAGLPPAERWRKPDHVPATSAQGKDLIAWYPGRIVATDDQGVRIVVATTEPESRARKAVESTLTTSEWNAAGGRAIDPRNPFIVLAVYHPSRREVFPQRIPPPPSWDESEPMEDLRALSAWAGV